jgi:nucleoid DNA-binding protein
MALPLVTQGQFVEELSEETGYSKSDVRHLLQSLEELVKQHISDCERVKIGNLVQFEPKLRKKQKARMGRNPATGEDVRISAKPASVRVAARVLKGAKESAPKLATLQKRLK